MTPTELHGWAVRWRVPYAALRELQALAGAELDACALPPPDPDGKSEAHAQSLVRLEAAHPSMGHRLFRNNVGALKDERGVPVRYGLANDTPAMNERCKSSDLIGWRRLLITPEMVGRIVAQFVAREVKPTGWTYTGQGREPAQLTFINLVLVDGGDAKFCTGPGTLVRAA